MGDYHDESKAEEAMRKLWRGRPPTEAEAQALNRQHGITCPNHPNDDCTHKARQRIAKGLPGHQA